MTSRMVRLTKRVGITALAIVICAFSVSAPAQAAEKAHHGRFVHQKAEFVFVKVGDVDGHVVGSYHQTGLAFMDGEIGARFIGGTFDYVNWAGRLRGYAITTFNDGSTITDQWEGAAKFDENKVRYYEGTYHCVSGTGRFKGIKCEGTWKQSSEKNGMGVGEFKGTMTLPD